MSEPHIIGSELPNDTNDPAKRYPRIHPSITLKRVMSAVHASMRDTSNAGFCHACGRKTKPGQFVEPDAEHYLCAFKSCGQNAVFGAEQTLLMMEG